MVGLRSVCHQRLIESGFMEKPGIEPAAPGLQDIGLSPTPRLFLYTWYSVDVRPEWLPFQLCQLYVFRFY